MCAAAAKATATKDYASLKAAHEAALIDVNDMRTRVAEMEADARGLRNEVRVCTCDHTFRRKSLLCTFAASCVVQP